MNDLISRSAAIDYLITNMNWYDEDGYTVDDADEKRAIITDLVNGIPAVKTVPVVHGRWINYPECLGYDGAYCDENIVCSNCKSVWNIIDNDADRFDYCPTCGARMDGEEHAS